MPSGWAEGWLWALFRVGHSQLSRASPEATLLPDSLRPRLGKALQGLSLGMDVPQEPLAAGTVTLPISQIKKLRLGELSHQPMVTEHITGAGFMEGQALCQGWDVGRGPDFVPCCAPPPSEVLQTLLHLCAPC